MVGLMATSSKRTYATLHLPGLRQPESPSLRQATANLCLHRRHSKAGLAQSLVGSLGPGEHRVLFVPSKRSVSLVLCKFCN